MKYLSLVILLTTALAYAEEASVPEHSAAKNSSCQQIKHNLNPLRALHRVHDGFVDLAIHVSSIGINQPPDPKDDVAMATSRTEPPARACAANAKQFDSAAFSF